MGEIPLKIVRDKIAAPPPDETVLSFQGGTAYLPDGNQLQIAAGTITMTFNVSGFMAAAKQVQDDLVNAIRMGILGPAEPAAENPRIKPGAPAPSVSPGA